MNLIDFSSKVAHWLSLSNHPQRLRCHCWYNFLLITMSNMNSPRWWCERHCFLKITSVTLADNRWQNILGFSKKAWKKTNVSPRPPKSMLNEGEGMLVRLENGNSTRGYYNQCKQHWFKGEGGFLNAFLTCYRSGSVKNWKIPIFLPPIVDKTTSRTDKFHQILKKRPKTSKWTKNGCCPRNYIPDTWIWKNI